METVAPEASSFFFIRHAEKDSSNPEDPDPELDQVADLDHGRLRRLLQGDPNRRGTWLAVENGDLAETGLRPQFGDHVLAIGGLFPASNTEAVGAELPSIVWRKLSG